MVGVAVEITESVRVPPVISYCTWVTPDDAPASRIWEVPETLALFDGMATKVLGVWAPATPTGSTVTAAARTNAPETTAIFEMDTLHPRPKGRFVQGGIT